MIVLLGSRKSRNMGTALWQLSATRNATTPRVEIRPVFGEPTLDWLFDFLNFYLNLKLIHVHIYVVQYS